MNHRFSFTTSMLIIMRIGITVIKRCCSMLIDISFRIWKDQIYLVICLDMYCVEKINMVLVREKVERLEGIKEKTMIL